MQLARMRLQASLALLILTANQALAADPFRFGVVNQRDRQPSYSLTQFTPMHAQLEAGLREHGIRLAPLVITNNIEDMTRLVKLGSVDSVIEGLVPTLQIQQDSQRLSPALLMWRRGQRQYHTVFFARRDSGIASLDGLQEKTIAFELPRSTSAHFVPRATLQHAGYQLVDAKAIGTGDVRHPIYYQFAGSELNQAYWVHAGKVDFAAFNNGDWQRTPTVLRDNLEVFHTTKPMLRWLLSFRSDLPESLREVVVGLLLALRDSPAGIASLQAAGGSTRFERLNRQDLDNLAHWRTVFGRLP